MSPADDVLEMQTLFEELAEKLARSQREKARINAIRAQFRTDDGGYLFTANRVREFLKGIARRVDSYEKDNARQRVAELRRLEAVNHINNLNRTLSYLRTADPDGYRAHADRVERALADAGVLDRTLAQTTE